jgi:hypothetical protein
MSGKLRNGLKKLGVTIGETELDAAAVHDLIEMYRETPALKLARRDFLAMTLSEPFTFHIKAMGIMSDKDMEAIIRAYWMPWLHVVFDYIMILGIAPYRMVQPFEGSPHLVPECPDIKMGRITVIASDNKRHKISYKWYWTTGMAPEEDNSVFWVRTVDAPDIDGVINSPLASLLADYRSLLILRASQNIASTQAARPVHVIEFTPSRNMGDEDKLTHATAQFGAKAAGISKARVDAARELEIQRRTAELMKQVRKAHHDNLVRTSMQPALWTDTPSDLLEEMDAGFDNRVVPLRPNTHYTSAAKPTLVADYYTAKHEFDIFAAALIGVALEKLMPTGSSRLQNVEGANAYEGDQARYWTSFFASIVKPALILA